MTGATMRAAPATGDAPFVQAVEVVKTYGLATVLDRVSLDVRAGEVHALVGENGAGKSTLARCLAGLATPTAGRVLIGGMPVTDFSVREAERRGVVLIHQELALAEHLSVAANMFLGHELKRGWLLDTRRMHEQASATLRRLGCQVDAGQPVANLAVSDRQMVEIGKALLRSARLIIMDEPTAVLTPKEAEHLFAQIRTLTAHGVAIVYVSHKLDEVKLISDRVSVLRDGRCQGTWDTAELTASEIANLMVGRELEQIYPPKAASIDRPATLEAIGFLGETSRSPVSFAVRSGEIFGVAGLVGSGRSELFESIVGLRHAKGGELRLHAHPFAPHSYLDALRRGVAYITEDRKGKGLLLAEPIGPNVALIDQILSRQRFVNFAKEKRSSDWAVSTFHIDVPFRAVRVGRLSGGNQQKVLLAKSLIDVPGVVIVDEPTRGIDVGTRAQIYRLLRRLADEGRAVVVISSDLQEIIGLSDRVLVMRDHRSAGLLAGEEIDERAIVQLATGASKQDEHRG
jgi:ribose transport system ATP-binding protein